MVKRRLLGGLIFSLALIATAYASPPASAVIGTPPQPGWTQLNPQQKEILTPLANEWEGMDNIGRKKWLGIAERYPNMKPADQQRMQDRMREWAKLAPSERAKVRDSYKDFNQLPPEQKQVVKQKWEAYSNLPADEKQRIREGGKSSRLLSPPPVTATNASANDTPGTPLPTSPATSGSNVR